MVLTELLTLVDESARLGIDDEELTRRGSSLVNTVGGVTGTASFLVRPNVFLNPPFSPSFGETMAAAAAPSGSCELNCCCFVGLPKVDVVAPSPLVGDVGGWLCVGVVAPVPPEADPPDFDVLPLDVAFLVLSLSLNNLNLSNIDFWLLAPVGLIPEPD